MFHVAIQWLDGVQFTTLGFTAPSWKLSKLREWSKSSRLSCFSQEEQTLFTQRREKPLLRLRELRGNTADTEREAKYRAQVIRELSSPGKKLAIAIDFPRRSIRNRCFVCFISTQWIMRNEEPAEKAMEREVKVGWEIREGTELSCAEVETDVQESRQESRSRSDTL